MEESMVTARIPEHAALKLAEVEALLERDKKSERKWFDSHCGWCGIAVSTMGYCWDCNRHTFKTKEEKKP